MNSEFISSTFNDALLQREFYAKIHLVTEFSLTIQLGVAHYFHILAVKQLFR